METIHEIQKSNFATGLVYALITYFLFFYFMPFVATFSLLLASLTFVGIIFTLIAALVKFLQATLHGISQVIFHN